MTGWLLWTRLAHAVGCGDVLTVDTTLTADVTCPPGFSGAALTLGAPGVTLDGAGHRVVLAGDGDAVLVPGFGSVTVRNVDLSGTGRGRGLLAWDADGLTLEDVDLSDHLEGLRTSGARTTLRRVKARGSRGWAVVLSGAAPIVEDLDLADSAGGLYLSGVSGFAPNTAPSVVGTRYGVYVEGGQDLVFDGWTFDGAEGVAVTIDSCDDCRISRSSFVGARTGIDVRGPHARLEIVGNDLSYVHGGWAVSVRAGVDDRIADNQLDGATFGLRLAEARDVSIASTNTFGTTGRRAVWVEDSVGVELSGLSLAGFEGTAITLLRCAGCGVRDTVMAGVGAGIEVVASDDVVLAGNDLTGAGRFGVHLADSHQIHVAESNTLHDRGRACGEGLWVDGHRAAPATTPDSDQDGLVDGCDPCDDPDRDGLCGSADPCVGVDPTDADGDRWCADTDCDDTVAAVHPGAAEATCNGIDDDCRPATADAPDADQDGFLACTDCDDRDPTTFPGAPETCDGRDDNCDSHVDEGLPTEAWFADQDGDSYGSDVPVFTCDGPPAGHVGNHADCDDTRPTAHPGAPEVPGNGVDDDCNRYTADNDDAT